LLLDNGGSHAASASMHRRHRAIAARGVHRLTVYVDPTAQTVLVRFASFPKAQNGLIDLTSPPVYQAVAEYLMVRGRLLCMRQPDRCSRPLGPRGPCMDPAPS
jgi:hypothetical protein